jgi:hypothetical protein
MENVVSEIQEGHAGRVPPRSQRDESGGHRGGMIPSMIPKSGCRFSEKIMLKRK